MATLYTENDLEDIKMYCQNEDTSYPDPDIMVDKNGKALYAYVCLVMLGDRYISAAIVLAYSIRKLGSKADLVVLVTNDVSDEGKKILAIYFDHIIEIDYVDIPNWRTKIQKQRKYLELVFTKFHIFKLTQYKKILLIDADAIVLRYPDHLFTLNAPAGCYLKNKEYIITYDDKGNYILPEDKEFDWYKKMCECCEHGKLIPKELTDNVMYDRKDAGIGGGIMLLEPKSGEFESILEDVAKGKSKYYVESKFAWPEQQYLTMRYSGKWHSINPIFFGLQGYPHWKVLYGMQYGGDKPFIRDSKFDLSIRLQYPDYVLWHKFFYDILQEHQEFYDMKALDEAIEMNKHFYSEVSKFNKNITKPLDKHIKERSYSKLINVTNKKEVVNYVRNRMYQFNVNVMNKNMSDKNKKHIIAKLLDINPERIKNNHLNYYSTNPYIQYRPFVLQPMWDDIGDYDYLEPIRRLADYFGKTSYYSKILDLYYDLATNITESLDTFDRIDPLDRDFIISNYIKSKKSTFILTFWTLVQDYIEIEELIDIIKEYGNIYYIKTITLNKNGLFNLMYWMYDEFTPNERIKFITEKLNYINAKEKDNQIRIFVLDNVNNKKISGQGAYTKTEIRNKVMDLLNSKKKFENIRGNDIVHINDHFYQTIDYSKILFNHNTLKLLENQNITNIASDIMKDSNIKINTFKKWCYQNLSLLEMERIFLMGSIVLQAYGIRKSNDLDGVFVSINKDSSQSEKELADVINDTFANKSTKLYFTDIVFENSQFWKESWTEKNKDIMSPFDVDNLIDLISNPNNHMYFNGIKIYLFDMEMRKKLRRGWTGSTNWNGDYADFIVIGTLYPQLITKYVELKDNFSLIYTLDNETTEVVITEKHLEDLIILIKKRFPYYEQKRFFSKCGIKY